MQDGRPDDRPEDGDAFFRHHFRPRADTDRVGVLGASGDEEDLEAGRRFLSLLAPGGWAVPTWPGEYGGRGSSPEEATAIARALARYDIPDLYPFAVGLALVGPTLLAHGRPDQAARFLTPIRSGEEIWCQLFSEPDAGSDLAGLRTRAEPDGERWHVTGQKTWTSRAHYADRGLLLARTDPHVPKHRGITAFAIPMRQPGVAVRPLRQINGDDHFSEVFLDGAEVDDRDRIGEVGDGWRVARTTLALERSGTGGGGTGSTVGRGQLVEHLRHHDATSDPVTRQRAAAALADMEVARLTVGRARAAAAAGRAPGPEGSGAKVRLAELLKRTAGLALDVQGPAAVTGEGDDAWLTVFLTAPSISIRGGTDEVQRDVIGERVLGLPREPRVDTDVAFSQTRRTVEDAQDTGENAF